MANVLLTLADPVEEHAAAGGHPRLPPSLIELRLLPESVPRRSRREWSTTFSASVGLHLVLFLVALHLPGPSAPRVERHEIVYKTIPLYLPPSLMTQKAPNRVKVSKQINLADLLASEAAQARRASPAPSKRHFEVPRQSAVQKPNMKNPAVLPNAPQVAVNQAPAPLPTGSPNALLAPAPPPPAPAQNPFQDIGVESPPSGPPKLAPPRATVQDAINGLTQNSNGRHLIISDDNRSQASLGSPFSPAANGGPHAAVELQSDPQGADFRDYLARILAIVRANWRRVVPESARMGQLRGRATIEFIIDRDGSIPKLVMADSSGSEPLDRAAVAGLSMSNPLPPLPADFKGFQVRLAFTFAYNMPSE